MSDYPNDGLFLLGLRIALGERVLVDDVSLFLQPGEVLGLVGRSGSGKSLTARALLGMAEVHPGVVRGHLEVRDRGRVFLPYDTARGRGRRARAQAFRPLRGSIIGWLPQDARKALDPVMSVGRQVRAAARLRGAGTPDDPRPWLRRVGFSEPEAVARRYPHELSGGMAQRAVIAQALARGSRYLLADEPTTGLDPTVRNAILREFTSLAREGLGILFITHDLRLLPGFADAVLVMDRGRVVERVPSELLATGPHRAAATRRIVAATRQIAGGRLG